MKSASGALAAFLRENNAAWFADLYTITVRAGTTYRWTTCDKSITYGGNTYVSDGSVVGRDSVRNAARELPSLDFSLYGPKVLGTGQTIFAAALDLYWEGAAFTLDHLVMPVPGDTSLGTVNLFTGAISEQRPDGTIVRCVARTPLEEADTTKIPRWKIQRSCPYTVYEPNSCAVNRASFTSTGTVSAGSTNRVIVFTGISPTNHYYDGGVITFTSGALSGARSTVMVSTLNSVTASVAFASAPAAGDTFSIYPGCNGTYSDCGTKFSNGARFRGAPRQPSGGVT